MEGEQTHCVLSVVTTVGTPADGRRLARLLLERRLAACVQIEPPMVSHYVWQGKPCEEPELRITIKTLPHQVMAIQALFAQHHPHALPQFLVARMQASAAYAAWVSESVAAAPGPPARPRR